MLTLHEYEREIIHKALEETHGNKIEAARLLGVSVKTIQNKLKEYKGTLSIFSGELPQLRKTKRDLIGNLSKDNLQATIEKLEGLLQCSILEYDKRYGGENERLNKYVTKAAKIRRELYNINMEG